MHLRCAHNPLCISLECLLHVEDRKLLLIQLKELLRQLRWQKLTPFGHIDPMAASHWDHKPGHLQQQPQCCWCRVLLWCCLLTWWHLWKSDGFLWNDHNGREGLWTCAFSPFWSLGAQAGCILAPCRELTWGWSVFNVYPISLAKGGSRGTFHETPWHRETSDVG